ncbi:MAG: hypothetical protein HFG75_10375 [Hungatella sp.]|nr:hypothetical protein [Hungatella sp.]
MRKQVIGAKDIKELLGISESKSYQIIRQLNRELAAKGYITIPGKVSRAYFEEKCYGIHISDQGGVGA